MVNDAIASQFGDEIGFHFIDWQWQLVMGVFFCLVCGQSKCYQNKICCWSIFSLDAGVWFQVRGIPLNSQLISYSHPPGVCTYLIWTVFISSGPDAFGQLFTMRSLLDI